VGLNVQIFNKLENIFKAFNLAWKLLQETRGQLELLELLTQPQRDT